MSKPNVPMICGGVYQIKDYRGYLQQGVLLAVQTDDSGSRLGHIQFFGHAPQQYEEGDVEFNKLELIGRPSSPRVGRPRKE
jgi:hypothetical protein